jgi:chaperonin GroES
MRIRPINDRVTIEKIEAPNRHGQIVIPDSARDPQQLGRVVDVGPGRAAEAPGGYAIVWGADVADEAKVTGDTRCARVEVMRPTMQVKAGDYVLFGKYSGATVKLDNRDVFMLREDEILAVVEGYEPPSEEETREQPELVVQ